MSCFKSLPRNIPFQGNLVEDILYRGGATAMKWCSLPNEHDQDEKIVPLVSGIVFFTAR